MTNAISMSIAVADVIVGSSRRAANPDRIRQLASSIGEIGLQHPITVRRDGDKFALIAGRHRLEAFHLLGVSSIPALIAPMNDLDARMWEIAENLHREELTVQERSDQIAEWIELSKQRAEAKKVLVQVAPKPQGGRPEGGLREAERELGLEHTETVRAVKIASISPAAKEAAREAGIDDNQSKLLKVAAEAPERQVETVHKLAGARSIMASRVEPDDSLDFFPTPPWATRALCQAVLPSLGIDTNSWGANIWEPACGEGHMAYVLLEYADHVRGSDIARYDGFEGQAVCDFLQPDTWPEPSRDYWDWIITNPPFGDLTIPFVLNAIELATEGVAMFVRSQWAVEGIERFARIFKPHPPTLMAFFSERVPLCKGRWDPDGTTATAYCWLVWRKGRGPQPPMWIPPGQRERLTKPSDRERFTRPTANPTTSCEESRERQTSELHSEDSKPEASPMDQQPKGTIGNSGTDELDTHLANPDITREMVAESDRKLQAERPPNDDGLDIPNFLKRPKPEAS